MYRLYFKRLLDVSISLVLLILLSPLLVVTSVILYFLNDGAGVFFYQERPGLNNKIFRIVKFKTMTDKRNEAGQLLSVSQRITPAGRFIRSLSIDELPQLLNVLRGDMSLIGPRPLLVQYLSLYNAKQGRRHEVRPGITGWAQCNGRNSISWQEKFEYDVWYVDHLSFKVDLKILLLTIKKVLTRSGINSVSAATMPTFTGNN